MNQMLGYGRQKQHPKRQINFQKYLTLNLYYLQVKDILSGKIDIKKLDEEERIKKEKKEKQQATKIFREEEKIKLAQEKIQKGNKGHGGGKNIYEKFCKFCFIEYEIKEYTNCYFCKKELITKEVILYI